MALANPKIRAAFEEYDRQVTLGRVRLGCYIGMALMPLGFVLDLIVYNQDGLWKRFLLIRLICAALIGAFLPILSSNFGRKFLRIIGLCLAMFPATAISLMIALSPDGPASPYYAGLNLVLLVVGFILHWTLYESVIAIALVDSTYFVACLVNGKFDHPGAVGNFFNNVYFLALTGIIVAVGNHFHAILRRREFELRYQLDDNRRSLEEANHKLVELDQVKSRFFANISHELRTPLTLLLAPLESVRAQKRISLDQETADLLDTMHSNGMRLLKLINDLLDLVKLESGKMEIRLEALQLPDFLRGLVNSTQGAARDKNISMLVHAAPEINFVMVDRDKLEKILLNLLFNSIKFTPARGQVNLHASREENRLVLKVVDTGMGIEPSQIPNLFSRFWQADTSARRKFQGTGIGLAIVKELAEVQKGSVSASSVLGHGTTMTVTLPFVPATEACPEVADTSFRTLPVDARENEWLTNLYRRAEHFPSITPVRDTLRRPGHELSEEGQKKPCLLIADDEPDMLRFLKSQLSTHYRVIEAVDGNQAVENASQFLPDLILVDMMMPEKDGLQVCRELRARTPTQNLPIILLTARADEETKLASLSAGANDFLSKPFSTTELHVRIRNLIDSHLLQRRLARQNQILEATIEQLKETELQLVQSEKLASLGKMSAGIIHEINNPLNYAKTGLFTLRRQGQSLPEEKRALYLDVLKDVEEAVERVKNIVSDLRKFTHPNPGEVGPVNLRRLVESAIKFMGGEFGSKVTVDLALPEDLNILANPNKLLQVVINLLQNSHDAVCHKEFGDEVATITIRGRTENGKTFLQFRDNGTGIKPEIIGKIFDPFFTTKDVGEGMGLGLSICYRIIEEYGGRIYAQSEPGKYCEFTLEFPAMVEVAAA